MWKKSSARTGWCAKKADQWFWLEIVERIFVGLKKNETISSCHELSCQVSYLFSTSFVFFRSLCKPHLINVNYVLFICWHGTPHSYISGVTILGTPSEIYSYGTQYWFIIIAIIFMGFAVSLVYLPVFCKLKVGSSYEVKNGCWNAQLPCRELYSLIAKHN